MTPRPVAALSAEALEDRLTPSTSSTLLPAFYADLLHRAPDPGSGGYAQQLDSGVRPASVAFQIETASSNEYRYDLVQSYYEHFLHRLGTMDELTGYVNQLANGATDEQIQAIIMGSQEYFQKHGSDNMLWLDGVYEDLLTRPDWEGAHLAAVTATNRATVALNVTKSAEFAGATVDAYYREFLGRPGFGDPGKDGYAQQLFGGTMSDEAIIAELVGSSEYLANHTNNGPTGPGGLVGPGGAYANAIAWASIAADGTISNSSGVASVTVHAASTLGTYSVVFDPSINLSGRNIIVQADPAAYTPTVTHQASAQMNANNAYTPAGVNGISVDTYNLNMLGGTFGHSDEAFFVIVT
jgi:hypothetical protein